MKLQVIIAQNARIKKLEFLVFPWERLKYFLDRLMNLVQNYSLQPGAVGLNRYIAAGSIGSVPNNWRQKGSRDSTNDTDYKSENVVRTLEITVLPPGMLNKTGVEMIRTKSS